MQTQDCVFKVGAETLAATKVYAASHQEPSVISFHGFGLTASRTRIRYMLDYLAQHGVSSACFDFSGNGDSTNFETATLDLRKKQALAAANELGRKDGSLALIGTSMGGFIAALLAPQLKPRSVVLISPAIYSDEAMGFQLDRNFPTAARAAGDYKKSSALRALSTFEGKLLIVGADGDTVLPQGTIDLYANCAQSAKSVKVIKFDTAEHKINLWLQDREEERSRVLSEVLAVTIEA
jgi:pimeloyl-ACP methyl ester carboxylesterase